MMVKGDQEGLSESKLYLESQDIFNYFRDKIKLMSFKQYLGML